MNSEIYSELPTFHTIGMLGDILKQYSSNISLTVNGVPGIVSFDERRRTIDIKPFDHAESDALWNFQYPATEQMEYMDF
jgi:hypothetical protein